MSPRAAARRFYLTPSTMAYPSGRVAVHVPAAAAVFVIETDGQWSPVSGLAEARKEWKRLSVADATTLLTSQGHPQATKQVPTNGAEVPADGPGQSTYRTPTT